MAGRGGPQAILLTLVPVASAVIAADTCCCAPACAALAAAGGALCCWVCHVAIAALEPAPLTRIPITNSLKGILPHRKTVASLAL